MNKLRDAWPATREEFSPTKDGGFAAEFGPYQLRLGKNVNLADAVTHVGGDGVTLKSGPIGIGFFDPVSGKSLTLASVQNAAPQQIAPNRILFADAFDNLHADYEVTYRKGGMSAEVILREAPALPDGFSDRTRLEVYTEFTPDTPEPAKEVRLVRQEEDPKAHANAGEPDFTDEWLTFGKDTQFVPGRAFAVDGNATDDMAVGKKFARTPDNRRVLVEAVEFGQLKPLLKDLKQAAVNKADKNVQVAQQSRAGFQPATTGGASVPASRDSTEDVVTQEGRQDARPTLARTFAHRSTKPRDTALHLARLENKSRGVVIDYTTI